MTYRHTIHYLKCQSRKLLGLALVLPLLAIGTAPAAALSANAIPTTEAGALSLLSSNTVSDSLKMATLRYRLNQIIQQNESQNIVTGVSIDNLQTNRSMFTHNQNAVQFAASTNKLPIAWLTLQDLRAGTLHLSDTVAWTADDVRGGYGVYDQPGAPTQATLQDVLFDMLNHSGNTAVRVVVNYELGGAAAVNDRLAQYPQIPNTRLQILDPTHFYVGNSTSKESLWIMEHLQKKHDSYEKFMQNALATNIFVSYGVRSQLEGNDYIVLANKVGILDDPEGNNRHDTGIIYNLRTHKAFAYSFMTTSPGDDSVTTMQAEASLQQMGRALLRYAGDKPQSGFHPQPLTTQMKTLSAPEKKIRY